MSMQSTRALAALMPHVQTQREDVDPNTIHNRALDAPWAIRKKGRR